MPRVERAIVYAVLGVLSATSCRPRDVGESRVTSNEVQADGEGPGAVIAEMMAAEGEAFCDCVESLRPDLTSDCEDMRASTDDMVQAFEALDECPDLALVDTDGLVACLAHAHQMVMTCYDVRCTSISSAASCADEQIDFEKTSCFRSHGEAWRSIVNCIEQRGVEMTQIQDAAGSLPLEQ